MADVMAVAWPRPSATDLTNRALTSHELFDPYLRRAPWGRARDGSADQEVSTR